MAQGFKQLGGSLQKVAGASYKLITGSFFPDGTNAPNILGMGFEVAHAGTGLWTVTIEIPFNNFVSLWAFKSTDETNNYLLNALALTVPTSTARGSFQILHKASADVSTTNYAAADITASGLLRRIHFGVELALADVPGNGV